MFLSDKCGRLRYFRCRPKHQQQHLAILIRVSYSFCSTQLQISGQLFCCRKAVALKLLSWKHRKLPPLKSFLISQLILCAALSLQAQPKKIVHLPAGHYSTLLDKDKSQWNRGDIVLISENRYRITTEATEGEYRTSITAQRIFFTTGPLRGFYARLLLHNNTPAIELPQAENSHQSGISSDVIAVWKQKGF
jgi:hypothetical protein